MRDKFATYLSSPHKFDVNELFEKLDSSENGLSESEATTRIEEFGPNILPEGKSVSVFQILLKQFKSALVLVLIAAAAIAWTVGEHIDAWVILAAILVNVVMGFFQEYNAQKAISSLKKSIVLTVKVLRNGQIVTLSEQQLVPGDIVILEEGDQIPADGRLIVAKNLRTMEAALTGESVPVSKDLGTVAEDTVVGDRKNMVWRGTFVVGGYAKFIVTGTGTNTLIGDISETLGEIHEQKSSFTKKTDTLAKQMSLIAIVSSSLIFASAFFLQHEPFEGVLLISIAALVAAIPEGLSVVISITLAIGAKRMARRNAIIREFAATETLGAVTTILTDKTGTLTQNSLTVRKIFIPEKSEVEVSGEGWAPEGDFSESGNTIKIDENTPALSKFLKIAGISNNSSFEHDEESDQYKLSGDPTEGALLVLAKKGGMNPNKLSINKLDDLPFNSNLKLRATLVEEEDKELMVTGAPEQLLDISSHVSSESGEKELSDKLRSEIKSKINEWSGQAMRVIALAYKKYDSSEIDEGQINDLVFAGIVGMIDPPRTDVKASVEKCKSAGIRVIMVTGDHLNTAVSIAKATGIFDEEDDDISALSEQQLAELDDEEFDKAIQEVSVFARLTPKMKMRIAGRLQEMGQLIAMTGDGVNDAPALKQADVGISMGIAGTDTARDASDVVLADDNFATIVNAVEEGRIVFKNVRKTSFFLITTNIAESVFLLIAITIGLPLPLTATQILWLNLVTDGVTDVALATEKGHGTNMQEKPKAVKEKILNKKIVPYLLINVGLMTGLSMGAFYYYLDSSIDMARTGAFAVMAFTQLFNVYNMRSLESSVFKLGFFSNRIINYAVLASVILLLVITEVPTLAEIFHFKSLVLVDYLVLFVLSSSVLWITEIYKWMKYHRS